jgi:sulfur-oxidizing protein SoxY
MQRRDFLKNTAAGTTLVAGAGLFPRMLMADWPEAAFQARSIDEALSVLLDASEHQSSGDILIKAPDIAENGAVVPVQVSTSLAKAESITLIAEKNPVPLIASFKFKEDGLSYLSTRIKMSTSSNLIAIVKADGKLYSTIKEVKVTIGGCGG